MSASCQRRAGSHVGHQITAGGAPLPSIKEPAPSGSAEWTTPSDPRRNNGRKGASARIVRTKSTPVGGGNGFGCLLGTDGNEGILGGKGKATGGSTPSGAVDSDKAKAMFATHAPSPTKFKRPTTTDPPGDADWTVSAKEVPGKKPAPGIPDWTTPSNPRRKKGRKGASPPIVKSIAPVGGKNPNGFVALLGTDGNEGILGGTSKVPLNSTPTTDSGATVDVETTTITTLEGSVSASGRFSWPKSYNLLRLFGMLALLCLGAAFAHSS
eukprot:CAMPEP_0185535214 /NCGR_PEP_ID=MMETSP1366-20130426/109333_1 /TAXON_ID=38817 /ORGANISM="Gephyrocapsa oceanica, Strain RCC1303" /LENGTH=267 /DNA_ID=CAMNT_0028146935 /DNA_START=104 /DNA_END=904 /DNA_ORIENTATION=+